MPVRSALTGSIIAVAAVVAAVVFGASLAGLLGTPRAYGQNWDAITDIGFGGVTRRRGRFLTATPAIASTRPATTARSPSRAGPLPRSGLTRAPAATSRCWRPRAPRRR